MKKPRCMTNQRLRAECANTNLGYRRRDAAHMELKRRAHAGGINALRNESRQERRSRRRHGSETMHMRRLGYSGEVIRGQRWTRPNWKE